MHMRPGQEALHSMLMSPIRTYSPALSPVQLTKMYYDESGRYDSHIMGPRMTVDMARTPREIDVDPYPRRTFAFVPPLTYQQRQAVVNCSAFVQQMSSVFDALRARKCEGYSCKLDSPAIDCYAEAAATTAATSGITARNATQGDSSNATQGDSSAVEEYFARQPTRVAGYQVYAEFLHVFTNELLYRGDREMTLNSYINAGTQQQDIVSLFFTPKRNTATMVTVTFDFRETQPTARASIRHYQGLIGDTLHAVYLADLATFSLSILAVLLLVLAQLRTCCSRLSIQSESGRRVRNALQGCSLAVLVEFLLGIAVAAYSLIHGLRARQSDDKLQQIYGDALQVQWANATVAYERKVEDYLAAVERIRELADEEDTIAAIAFLLMLLCILQVIQFMRVHPRVNILAATLVAAIDDIFHFFVSFLLIFVLFSVLACASFGRSMPEYSSIGNSLLTQYMVITGGIGDYGDNSTSYIIYLLLLFTVQGLFMLNFFLAIVIDAYAAIKQKIVDQITEQNIVVDLVDVIIVSVKQCIHGWPSARRITDGLKRLPSNSVTTAELSSLAGGGKSSESFVEYYSSYDFLLEEDESAESTGAATVPIIDDGYHRSTAPVPIIAESPSQYGTSTMESLESKMEKLIAQNEALLAHLEKATVAVKATVKLTD